jgi:hypothetical protein
MLSSLCCSSASTPSPSIFPCPGPVPTDLPGRLTSTGRLVIGCATTPFCRFFVVEGNFTVDMIKKEWRNSPLQRS